MRAPPTYGEVTPLACTLLTFRAGGHRWDRCAVASDRWRESVERTVAKHCPGADGYGDGEDVNQSVVGTFIFAIRDGKVCNVS